MKHHIADIIAEAFKGMAEADRGGLELVPEVSWDSDFILKGAQDVKLKGHKLRFSDSKNRSVLLHHKKEVLKILSARDDFKRYAALPKTISFAKDPYVDGIIEGIRKAEFSYPMYVKPNTGSLGKNCGSVENDNELFYALLDIFEDREVDNPYALVQEKIDVDREYRCVFFNGRVYLTYDRMFKERNIREGRVDQVISVTDICEMSTHLDVSSELVQTLHTATQIVAEELQAKYLAVDFIKDKNGKLWFGETNSAPQIWNAYHGDGVAQLDQMAHDIIVHIRGYE